MHDCQASGARREKSAFLHIFIRHTVLILLACAAASCVTTRQPKAERPLTPLNRFPRMVQEYFVGRARDLEQQADQQRSALGTQADAEAYVRDVQQKIQQCFGPWPDKTPLNPRITGRLKRDTYIIENLIFESRPGFLVTANLYIPSGRAFPLPGVIGTCGHSATGKIAESYQAFAQGLARQGYVVLIYDPLGQGERLQYPNDKLKSRKGVGVREHLYAGNQQILVNEFLGTWRAWDGIRALDYLLTRPEVDPARIGVTGNSGGGTMTTWLCGVERRWTMAAPSCFVTSFLHNLENELPADTEQCPPRALALGLDHSDFLAAMAPAPVIILAKEKDYFDVRGSEQALQRLQQLYGLLDAETQIKLFVGPTPHGFSQENREAMYQWFNHVTQISTAQSEPNLPMEEEQVLWCTPQGQVSTLESKPIYAFTREKSQMLAQQRPAQMSLDTLKHQVRQVLKLTVAPPQAPIDYRILRNRRARAYPKAHWTTYLVQSEPGIHAVVYRLSDERHLSRPPQAPQRAFLYVSHQSSDAELRNEPLIKELLAADPNAAFYTCDVRGIGESQPDTCGENSYLQPYGSDYFYATHSLMLGHPYVGQRTHDVLQVIQWLKQNGHTEIHLVGKGWGAIPATFAGLLADQVSQVTLKNALSSYSVIAESVDYAWPLSSLVPGILMEFDLPDCYRALAAKDLRLIDTWGPMQEVVTQDSVQH